MTVCNSTPSSSSSCSHWLEIRWWLLALGALCLRKEATRIHHTRVLVCPTAAVESRKIPCHC